MLIKCTKCKREFQQKKFERQCGCRPSNTAAYRKVVNQTSRHRKFFGYLYGLRRNFQDPIYQHFRLHHSEGVNGFPARRHSYEYDPYPEN